MTPSHARPAFARLRPTLVAAAFALAALPALQAEAAIVNGSFETGDFTGWTFAGNTDFSGVQCTGAGPTVASGACSAFLGAFGSVGTLSQSTATVAGASYVLSFAALFDGGSPGSFTASVNGVTLLGLTDPYSVTYQNFVLPFTATGNFSTVTFTFRDDTGFAFLDSVAVVPEPTSALLFAAGLGAVAFRKLRVAGRRQAA